MTIVTPWEAFVTPPEADSPAKRRAAYRAWLSPRLVSACCPSPSCSLKGAGPLRIHQVRDRAAWSKRAGDAQRVLIARAICTLCAATHTLLPECLAP
jgi:hypothetical protein